MSDITYHSRRAIEEFEAGMVSASHAASDAHLRLSSLHMAQLNQLQHEVTRGAGSTHASSSGRTTKVADGGQD